MNEIVLVIVFDWINKLSNKFFWLNVKNCFVWEILFNINTNSGDLALSTNEFEIGLYYRNKDAIIGVAGYKFKNYHVNFSYDHTISQLSQGNGGMGALEISFIVTGLFRNPDQLRNTYGCPRF